MKIIELTEIVKAKTWQDLLTLWSVGGLIVLALIALGFITGFKAAVNQNRAAERKVKLAISRSCIEYTQKLRPQKVIAKPQAAFWLADNCEKIADKSIERMWEAYK